MLAPYAAAYLPPSSPKLIEWVAAFTAALPPGSRLRLLLQGRRGSDDAHLVAWRAADGRYFARVDLAGGNGRAREIAREDDLREALAALLAGDDLEWEDPLVPRAPSCSGLWTTPETLGRWWSERSRSTDDCVAHVEASRAAPLRGSPWRGEGKALWIGGVAQGADGSPQVTSAPAEAAVERLRAAVEPAIEATLARIRSAEGGTLFVLAAPPGEARQRLYCVKPERFWWVNDSADERSAVGAEGWRDTWSLRDALVRAAQGLPPSLIESERRAAPEDLPRLRLLDEPGASTPEPAYSAPSLGADVEWERLPCDCVARQGATIVYIAPDGTAALVLDGGTIAQASYSGSGSWRVLLLRASAMLEALPSVLQGSGREYWRAAEAPVGAVLRSFGGLVWRTAEGAEDLVPTASEDRRLVEVCRVPPPPGGADGSSFAGQVFRASSSGSRAAPRSSPGSVGDCLLRQAASLLDDGIVGAAERVAERRSGVVGHNSFIFEFDLAGSSLRRRNGCMCDLCKAIGDAGEESERSAEGAGDAALVLASALGAPTAAAELAPWGALQALLAATSPGERPPLGPRTLAAFKSRGAASAAQHLASKAWPVGRREARVGAARIVEVKPWRWELRIDESAANVAPGSRDLLRRTAARARGREVLALTPMLAARELLAGVLRAGPSVPLWSARLDQASVLSQSAAAALLPRRGPSFDRMSRRLGFGTILYDAAAGDAAVALPDGRAAALPHLSADTIVVVRVLEADPARVSSHRLAAAAALDARLLAGVAQRPALAVSIVGGEAVGSGPGCTLLA